MLTAFNIKETFFLYFCLQNSVRNSNTVSNELKSCQHLFFLVHNDLYSFLIQYITLFTDCFEQLEHVGER